MSDTRAIAAQAELHHQYFLGLQLMVAVEEPRTAVFDWMFRLFRRQHEEKFLSGFSKLGLEDLPHAIACARYHVLSNGVGGVVVEHMEESDKKPGYVSVIRVGCCRGTQFVASRWRPVVAFYTVGTRKTGSV